MITLQTADKALKNFYLDAITKEIDSRVSPFLAKIEKTSANVVGKGVTKMIKLGLNGGIGAGSETGNLPESSDGDCDRGFTGGDCLSGNGVGEERN